MFSRHSRNSIRPTNTLGASNFASQLPSSPLLKSDFNPKLFDLHSGRPQKRQRVETEEQSRGKSPIRIDDDDETLTDFKTLVTPKSINDCLYPKPERELRGKKATDASIRNFGRPTEYERIDAYARPTQRRGKGLLHSPDELDPVLSESFSPTAFSTPVIEPKVLSPPNTNQDPRKKSVDKQQHVRRQTAGKVKQNQESSPIIISEQSPPQPAKEQRSTSSPVLVENGQDDIQDYEAFDNSSSRDNTIILEQQRPVEIEDSEDAGMSDNQTQSEGHIRTTPFRRTRSTNDQVLSNHSKRQRGDFRLKFIGNRNFQGLKEHNISLKLQDDGSFVPSAVPVDVIEKNQNFIIKAQKVHAIAHCTEAMKLVRVECARGQFSDDQYVYLEFVNGSDGSAFVRSLQERNSSIMLRTFNKTKMEKIFSQAARERHSWIHRTRKSSRDAEPEDITLMRSNKRRLEGPHLESSPSFSKQHDAPIPQHRAAAARKLFKKPASYETASKANDSQNHFNLRPKDPDIVPTRILRKRSFSPPLEAVLKYSRVYGLGPAWKNPLIYPATGRDRATVEFADLERLDDDEWLNDNLIMFYLKFLENTAQSLPGSKVYIFNTYFHRQLTDTKGLPRGSVINYQKVQKWTKVDIFDYDFLIVPICANLHWWMAVICNLPQLAKKLTLEADSEILEDPGSQSEGFITDHSNIHPNWSDSTDPERSNGDLGGSTAGVAHLSINSEPIDVQFNHDTDKDLIHEILNSRYQVENLGSSRRTSFQNATSPGEVFDALDSPAPCSDTRQTSSVRSRAGGKRHAPPPKKYDPNSPILISFDSLGHSRSSELRPLKDFIIQEGKSRRGLLIEREQLSGMTATGIPEQATLSDCGVYLLGYVRKLLHDPRELVTKVLSRTLNKDTDWPNFDVSKLREDIRLAAQRAYREQEALNFHAKEKQKTNATSTTGSSQEARVHESLRQSDNANNNLELGDLERYDDGFKGENLDDTSESIRDGLPLNDVVEGEINIHNQSTLAGLTNGSTDWKTVRHADEFDEEMLMTPPNASTRPLVLIRSYETRKKRSAEKRTLEELSDLEDDEFGGFSESIARTTSA